jgi:hypothetical protein
VAVRSIRDPSAVDLPISGRHENDTVDSWGGSQIEPVRQRVLFGV